MALQDLIAMSSDRLVKEGLSEERITQQLPLIRQYIAFWREYPDMFLEHMCGHNPENFKLFFYQRVFLRAAIRHRHAYFTFPRGYSKSFLSIITLVIRCILYPGSKLFITTATKEQAVSIAREKMGEICSWIPGIDQEINRGRGQTKEGTKELEIVFKNGSVLNIIAAQQSSRGKRATGGLVEEVILVDQGVLNEVVIPTMAIDRRLSDGSRRKEEPINKSQLYITTAGWKNSFAYAKLLNMLIQQIMYPDEFFILGGTWRVPVIEGLQEKNLIQSKKADGTYNESSFEREYKKTMYSINVKNCWKPLRVN